METYGKILLVAMPLFLLLVLAEMYYTIKVQRQFFSLNDMVSSLFSGVTNAVKDVLGLSVAIYTYAWMVDKVALMHIEATWLVYILAFIALDFAGYVLHSLQHKINFFWNAHMIHHSSEEFNLACALRQSIGVFVKLFAVFLLPAALLGIPAKVIAIVAPLHLFAQFWYHTVHIAKMGFLEKIIVTPSHHRVHHAVNPEYIDKNFSQIFIIWDKIFGTFQEELPEVKPVYGITVPVRTWNPIRINFQHLYNLFQDAWRTRSLKDKIKIWFMPTGWRPSDVQEAYPLKKIENLESFEKYATREPGGYSAWLWVQLAVMLCIVSVLFGNIATIGAPHIYSFGLYIFLFIYAAGEFMDNNANAIYWEAAKLLAGIFLAWVLFSGFPGYWLIRLFSLSLPVYGFLSFVATAYFLKKMQNADPVAVISEA